MFGLVGVLTSIVALGAWVALVLGKAGEYPGRVLALAICCTIATAVCGWLHENSDW